MKDFGTAAILCGGKSRRMGFDKSELKIQGKSIIEIIAKELERTFDEVILICNQKEKFRDSKYRVVEDIIKEAGPLGGIHAALSSATSKYIFVTACDMPFINTDYIEYMMRIIKKTQVQGVVSKNGEFLEPLYAFYSKDMLCALEHELKGNKYKVFETLSKLNIYYVNDEKVKEFSKGKSIFINLNYEADLALLKELSLEE